MLFIHEIRYLAVFEYPTIDNLVMVNYKLNDEQTLGK